MKKILIAEDDEFLIKVYASKLDKAEYETQIAKDGEEVGKLLLKFTPDIILLDLMMPKKDGFTVLKELKSSDAFKNIPVIVTSNLGQIEDKQKARELGAIGYLVKSDIQISEILERVKQVLGG